MKREPYVKPAVTTEKLEPETLMNFGSPTGNFGGGGGGGGFRGRRRWCSWGWGWWN